jgi:hypothetical protein
MNGVWCALLSSFIATAAEPSVSADASVQVYYNPDDFQRVVIDGDGGIGVGRSGHVVEFNPGGGLARRHEPQSSFAASDRVALGTGMNCARDYPFLDSDTSEPRQWFWSGQVDGERSCLAYVGGSEPRLEMWLASAFEKSVWEISLGDEFPDEAPSGVWLGLGELFIAWNQGEFPGASIVAQSADGRVLWRETSSGGVQFARREAEGWRLFSGLCHLGTCSMVMSVVGANGLEERYRKTSSTGPRHGVLDEDGPARPVLSVQEIDEDVIVVSGEEIWQVIGDWESWHLLTSVRCQEGARGLTERAVVLSVSYSDASLWGVTRKCGVFAVDGPVTVASPTIPLDSVARDYFRVVGLRDGFLSENQDRWMRFTDAHSWALAVDQSSLGPAPDGLVWRPIVNETPDSVHTWFRFESIPSDPLVEAFRPPLEIDSGTGGWTIGWDGKWYMYDTNRWRPQVWEVGSDSIRRVGEVAGGYQRIRLYAGRRMLAISPDSSFKLRGDEFRETEVVFSEASVSLNGEVAATDGERIYILGRKRDRAMNLAPGQSHITKLQYDGCGRLWSLGDRIHVQRGRRWVEVSPTLTPSFGNAWSSAGQLSTGLVVADRTKIATIEIPCW